MEDRTGYRIEFGTYRTNGKRSLRAWELKHVEDISIRVAGQDTAIGIPTYPVKYNQIFDTWGPVRTFTISGVRNDSEEEFSNFDFIHTQFNEGQTVGGRTPTRIGLEWLFTPLQIGLRGYYLSIVPREGHEDRRFINGVFNVALMGLSHEISADNGIGVMRYKLTLAERREGKGPVYKEWVE